MSGKCKIHIATILFFVVLTGLLWYLRSWNLEIGDGIFCCKQTIGGQAYAVTLSRSTFSHLLYRALFFGLHPILGWWVEDIIALSSCAAGLVFFIALFDLAGTSAKNWPERVIFFLFPSSTMLFQIFCGHIEFYSWTCALLMAGVTFAWRNIRFGLSPVWAGTAIALAAAFHTNAIFYFPAFLLIPLFMDKQKQDSTALNRQDIKQFLIYFALFIAASLLHRKPFHNLYLVCVIILIPAWFTLSPKWKATTKSWGLLFLPWALFYGMRAMMKLRVEPLIEHLPPFREPYDHGAYLYEAISWAHLYDKVMFHLWLAPFGLAAIFILLVFYRRIVIRDQWLCFLFHLSFWAVVWTTLFYPQLRTRDWDLFASMAIPLNLAVVYGFNRVMKPITFRWTMSIFIVVHLAISLPAVARNSAILTDRGYVELAFKPTPEIPARAFLRGLELGMTPLRYRYIRAGQAEVRIVPAQRGNQSWSQTLYLEPGGQYMFNPQLEEADNTLP